MFVFSRLGSFLHTGGLTAVIWTDFGQTIIMLAGGFVLMVLGKEYLS